MQTVEESMNAMFTQGAKAIMSSFPFTGGRPSPEEIATELILPVPLDQTKQCPPCDYDKNPTNLYKALEARKWLTVERFLRSGSWAGQYHPNLQGVSSQVCTWVTKYKICLDDNDDRDVFMRLPIHAALIFGAPDKVISLLVKICPGSLCCADEKQMVPLHLAFQNGASYDTIATLLDVFPEAIGVRDCDGRTPLETALESKRCEMEAKIFEKRKHTWNKIVEGQRSQLKYGEEKSRELLLALLSEVKDLDTWCGVDGQKDQWTKPSTRMATSQKVEVKFQECVVAKSESRTCTSFDEQTASLSGSSNHSETSILSEETFEENPAEGIEQSMPEDLAARMVALEQPLVDGKKAPSKRRSVLKAIVRRAKQLSARRFLPKRAKRRKKKDNASVALQEESEGLSTVEEEEGAVVEEEDVVAQIFASVANGEVPRDIDGTARTIIDQTLAKCEPPDMDETITNSEASIDLEQTPFYLSNMIDLGQTVSDLSYLTLPKGTSTLFKELMMAEKAAQSLFLVKGAPSATFGSSVEGKTATTEESSLCAISLAENSLQPNSPSGGFLELKPAEELVAKDGSKTSSPAAICQAPGVAELAEPHLLDFSAGTYPATADAVSIIEASVTTATTVSRNMLMNAANATCGAGTSFDNKEINKMVSVAIQKLREQNGNLMLIQNESDCSWGSEFEGEEPSITSGNNKSTSGNKLLMEQIKSMLDDSQDDSEDDGADCAAIASVHGVSQDQEASRTDFEDSLVKIEEEIREIKEVLGVQGNATKEEEEVEDASVEPSANLEASLSDVSTPADHSLQAAQSEVSMPAQHSLQATEEGSQSEVSIPAKHSSQATEEASQSEASIPAEYSLQATEEGSQSEMSIPAKHSLQATDTYSQSEVSQSEVSVPEEHSLQSLQLLRKSFSMLAKTIQVKRSTSSCSSLEGSQRNDRSQNMMRQSKTHLTPQQYAEKVGLLAGGWQWGRQV